MVLKGGGGGGRGPRWGGFGLRIVQWGLGKPNYVTNLVVIITYFVVRNVSKSLLILLRSLMGPLRQWDRGLGVCTARDFQKLCRCVHHGWDPGTS